jgi:hypothetical protein
MERVNGRTNVRGPEEEAMPKTRRDRLSTLIKDVESVTKRLRNDIRKRANAKQIQKNLQTAAVQLRKRAASTAAQVEKYVHDIRKELEGQAGAAAKKTKRTKRRTTRRKRTGTRRKSAS